MWSLHSLRLQPLQWTAISRCTYVHLRFRYSEVVKLNRVVRVLFACWLASLIWSSLWFLNRGVQDILRIVLFLACLLTTTSSYLVIYKHIRRRQFCVSQRIGKAFLPATGSFNPIRFRRSVSSMFYIYCFLLVRYLPYTCIIVFVNRYQLTPLTLTLNSAFCSLLFFNSALNPFVFCRRIQERYLCKAFIANGKKCIKQKVRQQTSNFY